MGIFGSKIENNVSVILNNLLSQTPKQTVFQPFPEGFACSQSYQQKLQKRIFTKKHARV
jgi:hypothetical protein